MCVLCARAHLMHQRAVCAAAHSRSRQCACHRCQCAGGHLLPPQPRRRHRVGRRAATPPARCMAEPCASASATSACSGTMHSAAGTEHMWCRRFCCFTACCHARSLPSWRSLSDGVHSAGRDRKRGGGCAPSVAIGAAAMATGAPPRRGRWRAIAANAGAHLTGLLPFSGERVSLSPSSFGLLLLASMSATASSRGSRKCGAIKWHVGSCVATGDAGGESSAVPAATPAGLWQPASASPVHEACKLTGGGGAAANVGACAAAAPP